VIQYRKAWEVVAWTYCGAVYCPECAPAENTINEQGETPAPVFLSDEFYIENPDTGDRAPYPCDKCQEPIDN